MSRKEKNNFWNDFQKFLGVDIPSDIIKILNANGYNNALSLSGMSLEDVDRIEQFTTEKLKDILTETTLYSDMNSFCFLPGHKKLLLVLGEKSKEFQKSHTSSTLEKWNSLDLDGFSHVMKELINTAKNHVNVPLNSRRYSEIIQWFAIYIFILSGKRAYEVLSKNLPLPQVPTISEHKLIRA